MRNSNYQNIKSIPGNKIKPINNFDCANYRDLGRLGIHLNVRGNLNKMIAASAMDAIQPTVTTASITTPVQFLQNWLPGFVKVITAARKIDEVIGIATVGSWEDEQVVQGTLELTGYSVPYGDYTNVPFSSWNTNFVTRTLVRFEEGMKVGVLEEARAARINIDTGATKRESAALALEIVRNSVGFFGFNSGNNFTYGFLNDPNLPAYYTVPVGVSGFTTWNKKTYLEITADIRTAIANLRTQSQDQIDPESVNLTLVLPTSVVDYLTVSTDFGYSVRQWLTETYPRVRVVSAPELVGANGGANVGYIFADEINDLSTDGNRTWIQVVPAKFLVLGVQQLPKGYEEDYANATAGAMLKRPWAVIRFSGI